MNKSTGATPQREGLDALAHMEKALELLDTFDPGVEVAGHVDLAICRLRAALQTGVATKTKKKP